MTEAQLTSILQELGATDPRSWAHSQVVEGTPQLLRFLFLQQSWAGFVQEGDTSWIDAELERSSSDAMAPFSGLGLALGRCLSAGVSADDLTEIARCLQAQALFHVGYVLEGPDVELEALEDVSWGLFQIDESGMPHGPCISGLHESVLETDPTGREMRPHKTFMQGASGGA
jgi:hypothetical protein